jgi:hypothetical protein
MIRTAAAVLIAGFASVVPLVAQQQPATDEARPLERYLGQWSYDGEDLTTGGGPVRCTSTRRWTGGGHFIESQRRCSTPRGDIEQLEVYGHDVTERVYRYWGFNGRAVSQYTTPAIDGLAIHWSSVPFRGRVRCTETFAAGFASSASSCETSSDGSTWRVVSQGRSTRTAP